MNGHGIKQERETVIAWNEEDETAFIWTASETTYRRLLKLGYFPSDDRDRSATFVVPKRDIKLPRPKDQARSKRMKERVAAGKGILSSDHTDGSGSKAHKPLGKGIGKG